MPATLVPNVVPAPANVRTVQKSVSRETAPSGEEFEAALTQARHGGRSERKQDAPAAETPAPARSSRKAEAKSKKDAQEADESRETGAGEEAAPKQEAEAIASAPAEPVAEDEEQPSAEAEPDGGDDVPPADDAIAGLVDPTLVVTPETRPTVAVDESEAAVEEHAVDGVAPELQNRATVVKSAVPFAAGAEGQDTAEAEEAALEDVVDASAGPGALDLTEIAEAMIDEAEAESTPVAATTAKPIVPAMTKPADAPEIDATVQPLQASAASLEAETGTSDGNGEPSKAPTTVPTPTNEADDLIGLSAEAVTFDDRLSEATEAPADDTLTLPQGTPKAQQVVEREVVQQGTPSPLRAFAQENHEKIVTGVRTQLLPNGGSMQIKLTPGDLGQMQISVRVIDGALSATFQTSNDEATRLLSHSLTQLKTALESQGVSVDRIQVTQAPREPQATRPDDGQQQQQRENPHRQQQQEAMQQEHQRRQLLNRMWRRMAGGGDPLDLVA